MVRSRLKRVVAVGVALLPGVWLAGVDARAGAMPITPAAPSAMVGGSQVDVSADGRFELSLVGSVLRRVDLSTGASVTVAHGTGTSAISGDGRYVAFEAEPNGIVAGDTDGRGDVFRTDLSTGETVLVSSSLPLGFDPDGYEVDLSADGQTVSFSTTSPAFGRLQIMVVHVPSGRVYLPSEALAAGEFGRRDTYNGRLSADGLFVVFSLYTVSAGCTNGVGCGDIYRYDTTNGDLWPVSVTPAGAFSAGIDSAPDISSDGRFVSFIGAGSDVLAGLSGNHPRLFRRDLLAGSTVLVSDSVTASFVSAMREVPRMSADGRRVVFVDSATTAYTGFPAAPGEQIFVRDLGEVAPVRVSTAAAGGPSNSVSHNPAISADGRTVTYETLATDIVAGGNAAGVIVAQVGAADVAPAAERLVDTRYGVGAAQGVTVAYTPQQVVVAGHAGVPADATAVWLNVTVTDPTEAGFVTLYPCGGPIPLASNVNFVAGQTVANLVLVGIGTGGAVCWISDHPTQVIIDVQGSEPASATYAARQPLRVLDTRNAVGAPAGRLVPGQVLELAVAGVNGVPADATTVTLNVTVTEPVDGGYLTVYPCGTAAPLASNINFTAGQQVAGLVVVKPGTDGKVCFSAGRATHVVADLQGHDAASSTFHAVSPFRVLDTRENIGGRRVELEAGVIFQLPLRPAGVANNAAAVLLNTTVIDAAASGYLTVFTCGQPVTAKSNVNFPAQAVVANLVRAVPDSGGNICIYPTSKMHLVMDVSGWYTT